jgi:hypothetical protein
VPACASLTWGFCGALDQHIRCDVQAAWTRLIFPGTGTEGVQSPCAGRSACDVARRCRFPQTGIVAALAYMTILAAIGIIRTKGW